MNNEPEINFCMSFFDKVSNRQGVENKVRYLVEDFLFEEGWASKGNSKNGKDGYSHQYTYNYSTLRHFTEDLVRFVIREFKIDQKKNLIPRSEIMKFIQMKQSKNGALSSELLELRDMLR